MYVRIVCAICMYVLPQRIRFVCDFHGAHAASPIWEMKH